MISINNEYLIDGFQLTKSGYQINLPDSELIAFYRIKRFSFCDFNDVMCQARL